MALVLHKGHSLGGQKEPVTQAGELEPSPESSQSSKDSLGCLRPHGTEQVKPARK